MKPDTGYIEVAVALPVFQTFTYSAPESFAAFVAIGKRVLIPFGRRRITGTTANIGNWNYRNCAPRSTNNRIRP